MMRAGHLIVGNSRQLDKNKYELWVQEEGSLVTRLEKGGATPTHTH